MFHFTGRTGRAFKLIETVESAKICSVALLGNLVVQLSG